MVLLPWKSHGWRAPAKHLKPRHPAGTVSCSTQKVTAAVWCVDTFTKALVQHSYPKQVQTWQ